MDLKARGCELLNCVQLQMANESSRELGSLNRSNDDVGNGKSRCAYLPELAENCHLMDTDFRSVATSLK